MIDKSKITPEEKSLLFKLIEKYKNNEIESEEEFFTLNTLMLKYVGWDAGDKTPKQRIGLPSNTDERARGEYTSTTNTITFSSNHYSSIPSESNFLFSEHAVLLFHEMTHYYQYQYKNLSNEEKEKLSPEERKILEELSNSDLTAVHISGVLDILEKHGKLSREFDESEFLKLWLPSADSPDFDNDQELYEYVCGSIERYKKTGETVDVTDEQYGYIIEDYLYQKSLVEDPENSPFKSVDLAFIEYLSRAHEKDARIKSIEMGREFFESLLEEDELSPEIKDWITNVCIPFIDKNVRVEKINDSYIQIWNDFVNEAKNLLFSGELTSNEALLISEMLVIACSKEEKQEILDVAFENDKIDEDQLICIASAYFGTSSTGSNENQEIVYKKLQNELYSDEYNPKIDLFDFNISDVITNKQFEELMEKYVQNDQPIRLTTLFTSILQSRNIKDIENEGLPEFNHVADYYLDEISQLKEKKEYTKEELVLLIGVSTMSEDFIENRNNEYFFGKSPQLLEKAKGLNTEAEEARDRFGGYMSEEDYNKAYSECKEKASSDKEMKVLMKAKLLEYRSRELYETEKEIYGEKYANEHREKMLKELEDLKKKNPELFVESEDQSE